MGVAAGQLRERVTLERRGADENGDALAAFAPFATVSARARALKGSEPVIQARLQGVQPVEFTVRATPVTRAVTTANRVRWNDAPYDIQTITPSEDRATLTILAQAAGG